MKTIGIVGNPNCGKTTLFNGLTGSHQHIGNWPGVTVEKKEGFAILPSTINHQPSTINHQPSTSSQVKIVDLPGIYSLSATSEDEKASLEYILSHEADLYINVLDATTLERNLYLTLLLCELKVPMVIVVTMMDIVRQRNINIDLDHLAAHLGVPVIGVDATKAKDLKRLTGLLADALAAAKVPAVNLDYGNELENEIDILSSAVVKTAAALKVAPRWVAIKALEGDPLVRRKLEAYHDMAPEVVDGAVERVTKILADPPDIELAEARYGVIAGLVRDVVTVTRNKAYLSEKIDRVVINRFLGIPLFLGMMYLVFWFTQAVGGAFIDFFDILGDTVFVSGLGHLMSLCHAPEWLIAIVANGAGTAIQTVMTFLPPVGFMFLALAVLEDSGYMARAAFVMDRFMRWIGLPGKSFVPMLVGFGCSVPAIMATRTLDSKRDRFLTVFMAPFMSCGAKLPIWVLFGAAFFPQNPGKLVFLIYVTGIVLGIVTGLILKHTLFQGAPTHFIMELPPYHCPRPKHILLHTWERLKIFIWRAGKFIVPMVLVLGVLNTVGTDGTIGHEDSKESLLSVVGKAITPVFEPIGVEPDNWPASVSIFTGLFAKESVIGTMKGLYGQMESPKKESSGTIQQSDNPTIQQSNNPTIQQSDNPTIQQSDNPTIQQSNNPTIRQSNNPTIQQSNNPTIQQSNYSFIGGIREAFATIPENLSGVFGRLADPLDMGGASEEAEVGADAAENSAAIDSLRRHFPKGFHQVFAFLLFVLLYVPCLAATGVVYREIGKFYGTIFVGYLTLLGWSVATIYHAVMVSGSSLWFSVGSGLLAAMFTGFWAYGRKHRVDMI